MASRRKLKKTINSVSMELISELYFRVLIKGKSDESKVEELAIEIADLSEKFTLRVNHPDGKDNPALVKKYFHKLYSDWDTAIEKLMEKMDKL